METVRLRLVFEKALAESLKKKTGGLKRFWVLLKPQHKTIDDLSRYLLDVFDLYNACPEGLLLSMEGFYLPPFESSCVLKDRDIVRVKSKTNLGMLELVAGDGGGVKFLANEEFEKEAGGYESDDPEEEDSKLEDAMLHVEETPEMKKVSKKRKASEELGSSKKKKKKKEIVSSAEKCAAKVSKTGEEGTSKAKKSSGPNQCSDDHVDASCSPSGDKKVPSRSARRKKAKRQWLKEIKRAEKEKEEKHLSAIPNGKASQDHKATPHLVEKKEKHSPVTPDEKASKKKPKIIKELVEKNMHTSVEEVPDKGNEKVQVDDEEQPDQNSDTDDNEIVPIVIRPGHIRFEPLEKGSADQTVQHNQTLVDTSQWNGMSKKKGPKWGKQNSESWKWNENGNSVHKPSETWKENSNSCQKPSETCPIDEEDTPVCDHIDFDKLPPYASSPKEADIIAYRLIQLSSSWTPELSAYLVGKISEFNPQSNKIKLVAVPKYSLIPQNNEEDDETLPETCALQDDGSLEMEFSSLLEVRTVKCSGSTNQALSATAAGVVVTSAKSPDTPTKAPIKHCTTDAVNSWDEISQALSAKKAELSQGQSWNKPEKNSGGNQKTVKPWRGSALGPTMALLRAQNGI